MHHPQKFGPNMKTICSFYVWSCSAALSVERRELEVVPQKADFWPCQVALPAMLWGAGTALGEVPPYAISFHAAKAGIRNAEFESMFARHEPHAAKGVLGTAHEVRFFSEIRLLIYFRVGRPRNRT